MEQKIPLKITESTQKKKMAMQANENNKSDMTDSIRPDQRLKALMAVYLSLFLLAFTLILILIPMNDALQQALIIVLGLVVIITIDAFRKIFSDTGPSAVEKELRQFVFQEGSTYVDGATNYINIPEGQYSMSDSYNTYRSGKDQTLAEAAAEIQDLLRQLEESNPTATEEEKVAYIEEEIEPDAKSRILRALKSGGTTVFEGFVDSRYLDIVKMILKDWV